MPLRVTEKQEALGMDVVQHGEEAYAPGEGAILVAHEADGERPVPVAQPQGALHSRTRSQSISPVCCAGLARGIDASSRTRSTTGTSRAGSVCQPGPS